MKLASYLVLGLLASCALVDARGLIVPPPPPLVSTLPVVNQLSFREHCALIALQHVLETKGSEDKQVVLAAWSLADSMEVERVNRLKRGS